MFSIIIPLYNKELSIKNTIQSVLNQTYQDFEIIVINDGSTDNSAKVVESISDNRIRLEHQANQGVSAARNYGIKEAGREWIAFLDGDDLWEVNHLEEIKKMMHLFPDEKVYVTSFEYSDKRNAFKHPRKHSIFKIENYFKEALKERLVWTSIIVINKICFDNVGGFNESISRGEDTDLWVRLARNYDIVKSSIVTATYRVEAENRSSVSKVLENTHIFYVDLDLIVDIDERIYYKDMILKRLYEYNRVMDVYNVFKLKRKHPQVSYREYILFASKNIGRWLKKYKNNF